MNLLERQKHDDSPIRLEPPSEMSWPRRLVEPVSWAGHLPFAQWLVEAVRPQTLVELGVHTGNSYCAFAQAIDRLGLATRAFGVDHWVGDPHAGLYGEEVYAELKAYHDPLYGHFSNLLRMSFDEALAHVPNGSVDILHIDGLHTYEAVRHDFETWLPKMGTRGVVLLHDTNVRHGDFGVWRLWREIAADRPAIEFLHSNGLGVLYVGTEKPPETLGAFFAAAESPSGVAAVRRYFARLGEPLVTHLAEKAATARSNDIARVLRKVHAEAQGIMEEASALKKERVSLRARDEVARRWDSLALHLSSTTGVSLDEAAAGIRRLYNSDDPQALADRTRLGHALRRVSEGRPVEPSTSEIGARALLGLGADITARRLLRRTLTQPAPALQRSRETGQVDPAIEKIRESGLFDETYYAHSQDARRQGLDPLFHYLDTGEKQGLSPSKSFDPVFYARRYPDVRDSGWGLLRHYVLFGRSEGREPLSPAGRMVLSPLEKSDRQRVLVFVHDASRTGAPVLAWNLVSRLSESCDVVVVLKAGGPLEDDFRKVAAEVVTIPEAASLSGIDLEEVVDRLVEDVHPHFAVLNTVETRSFAPRLSARGVGVVALVHEFSANVHPHGAIYDMLIWAHHVVFPAEIVLRSFENDYPFTTQRRVSIIPQGVPTLPPRPEDFTRHFSEVLNQIRPAGAEKDLLVIGMGFVHLRKGVDLFIAAAAAALRSSPSARLRFAWIGGGYLPDRDIHFSTYLADQVERSGLKDRLVFVDELEDLGGAIEAADLVVLSSRLDPMPNTAIEALSRGKPVVCFQDASGVAELLASSSDLSRLVVPYLDTGAMGSVIAEIAEDRAELLRLSEAASRMATDVFDMERYVGELLALGKEAHQDARALREDAAVIKDAFDATLFTGLTDAEVSRPMAEYLVRNKVVRTGSKGRTPVGLRRPAPGFNPLAFAEARMSEKEDPHDPFARWILEGRPQGTWSHPVIRLEPEAPVPPEDTRVLLHAHFHYIDLLGDLLHRLPKNRLRCDLVITVTSTEAAEAARGQLDVFAQGSVEIRTVPNRGRDIGAFLTGISDRARDGYDVIGHVHGKKSPQLGSGIGSNWREFLLEHLVGGVTHAADTAVSAIAGDPTLGVVFPEDPNLCGWDANRKIAGELAKRMGIEKLPESFDWPNGTMFWARPAALAPLFDLRLDWSDYPAEPVPGDGTLLHALERLIPLSAAHAGFHYATTYLPGVSR